MVKLTAAQLRVLRIMIADDEEILCDGLACWIGDHRTSWAVVYGLLRLCAISDVSDTKGAQRYAINGTGRALAADPQLATAIAERLLAGEPFSIVDGRVVEVSAGRRALQEEEGQR